MKVTLARALKERSRLAGKLKRNFAILGKENSAISGSERSYDLRAIYAECKELHTRLIALKKIIAVANAPIAEKLVEMDEIKSMTSYLNGVDATIGYKTKNYSNETIRMDAVIGYAELTAEAERLQKRGEQLQDELDEYNVLTQVTLP